MVDEGDYARALGLATEMNPNRTKRLQQRRLATFTHCCADPLRVGMGLAAMAGKEPDVVCGVGGATFEMIDGEEVPEFAVMTMRGRLQSGQWQDADDLGNSAG